jgi:hypothetical protein
MLQEASRGLGRTLTVGFNRFSQPDSQVRGRGGGGGGRQQPLKKNTIHVQCGWIAIG